MDIQVRSVVQYYTGVADLDPVDSEPFMRDPGPIRTKRAGSNQSLTDLGEKNVLAIFTHKKTLSQLSHHPNSDIL